MVCAFLRGSICLSNHLRHDMRLLQSMGNFMSHPLLDNPLVIVPILGNWGVLPLPVNLHLPVSHLGPHLGIRWQRVEPFKDSNYRMGSSVRLAKRDRLLRALKP